MRGDLTALGIVPTSISTPLPTIQRTRSLEGHGAHVVAEAIRIESGEAVFADPRFVARGLGLLLAPSAAPGSRPIAGVAPYQWCADPRERGWSLYLGIAEAFLVRERLPREPADVTALAEELAVPARLRTLPAAEVLARQTHVPAWLVARLARTDTT